MTLEPTRTAALRATAYHEAGHAVASYLARRGLRFVTIVPDADYLGRCYGARFGAKVRPDVEVTLGTRAALEAQITVLLAGGIAERRVRGRWNSAGSRSDSANAIDLGTFLCGSAEETSAFLGWRQIVAEQLLAQPWHWGAVEALAQELLKDGRIGGPRARGIIRAAITGWRSHGARP